jgi:hypothetical protein
LKSLEKGERGSGKYSEPMAHPSTKTLKSCITEFSDFSLACSKGCALLLAAELTVVWSYYFRKNSKGSISSDE